MADFLFIVVSATAIIQCFLASLFICGLIFRLKNSKKRVSIIVLGDIGRSPRMQYHAMSFAKENFCVDIIGFKGSPPIATLKNNKFVNFIYLLKSPLQPSFLPKILYYVIQTVFHFVQLVFVLIFVVEKPDHLLIQNPPSIPAVAATWFVCCVKGSNMIIDWHNYGYSILSMNLKSEKHLLVRISKIYEKWFGRQAYKNICVTKAMKDDLKLKWGIESSVLYDRPPEFFKKLNVEEKHDLFLKLSQQYAEFKGVNDHSTLFTEIENGVVKAKVDRPVLLISSTSWTEDEDFSLLLNALEIYEGKVKFQSSLPKMFCVITGKGPLKEYYTDLIKEKNFEHVQIVTPWLPAEDYPKIIGSGDLGICLHTSSSGLDLPMKVVDMFGCCLPVCAVRFSCLHELVKENENGLMFDTSPELAEQFFDLFKDFPNNTKQLDTMQSSLQSFKNIRWHSNWKKVFLPLVDGEK